MQPFHQLGKVRVVAAGERQNADLVEARAAITFQRRVDDCVDLANSQRPFDHRALAEPAQVRATSHDLDRDSVVHAVDVRHNGLGRQRHAIQVTDHAGCDCLRHVIASSNDRSDSIVVGVLRLVEPRHISKRQLLSHASQSVFALLPAFFAGHERSVGQASFFTKAEPQLANLWQRRLAVAGHHHIEDVGHWLRVLTTWSSRNQQRIRHRPVNGVERDPAEVDHRQHVGRADFVLQRQPDNVKLTERRERFERVERQVVLTQFRFHVRPRHEDSLGTPIVSPIDHRIQDLQPVMAHPNRVRIGESNGDFPA
ncbi:hypothetical protein RE6C_01053 [Rhodopirellula europaea 6C]|uniref:Uncharacterized protein n=1 Tax=Rhodopirellula europaea 6C TaxID=1263867 RepID=M2B7P1_9BACT|nr:hypothetical protein RE6C_01053 [Rhodopirellula europaea 6C]